MSEQILLLNRRRKARKHNRRRRKHNRRRPRKHNRMPAALARYWATHKPGSRRKHNRRRRRRHNRRHTTTGRRVRHHNTHHMRRRRHNRRSIGSLLSGGGGIKNFLVPAAIGAAGGVGFTWLWNQVAPKLTFLPATFQSGWGGVAVRLAMVFGVSTLASRFAPANLKTPIKIAGAGAGTIILGQAFTGLLSGAGVSGLHSYIDYQSYALPGARMGGYMPMAGYMPRTLNGLADDMYTPAAVIQPQGTPMPRQFAGLRNYIAVQPHMGGAGNGLCDYNWQNDGM